MRYLPAIEAAFLNGQQTPTVERSDADFNVLGIQFRGRFFDFGVALQGPRAPRVEAVPFRWHRGCVTA